MDTTSLSGKRVRLSKLAAAPQPRYNTAKWEEHVAGEENPGQSLPVDYWVEGEICQSAIKILLPILIRRDTRNGVKADGYLKTSPVQHIETSEGVIFITTENSVYKLEVLGE